MSFNSMNFAWRFDHRTLSDCRTPAESSPRQEAHSRCCFQSAFEKRSVAARS
jgi:hypothetical protein